MSAVKAKLPGLPTHEYNRMYEARYEVLSKESEPLMKAAEFEAIRDAFQQANLTGIKVIKG